MRKEKEKEWKGVGEKIKVVMHKKAINFLSFTGKFGPCIFSALV